MPDVIFDDRRLAAIYNSVDADRSDLDAYVALADELVFLVSPELGIDAPGSPPAALRPRGFLVFEVRDPAREGWKEWNHEDSHRRL